MFKTLEMFKKEIEQRRKNDARVCNRTIVCTGAKGGRGPAGPPGAKGEPGYTVFAQSAFTAPRKGQKGDIGPRGPPGPSIEKPRILAKPRDVTAQEGSSAKFSCVSYGNPKPEVEWMFNGEGVAAKTGRIRLDGNGALHVENLAANDAGTVMCTATNFLGKVTAEAKIAVHTPPSLTVGEERVMADLGKQVELTCSATGIPAPLINWKRINGTLPENAEVTSAGSLVIKNVKESDEGTYKCIGQNAAGTAQATTLVLVKIPPTVGLVSREVLTYTGMEAMELICRVTGFPKPEIKWERVDGEMPKNAVTTQEGNLVLAKVTKNDEGTYRCVGENSAGKSEGLAEIRVQSVPEGSRPKSCKEVLASGNGISDQIDLEDFKGSKVYAEYSLFKVDSESDLFRMHVYGYSGNASDSLSYHNNMPFSTKDRDYDKHASRHCAVYYSGGWWYRGCHKSNLNGIYPTDSQNHPSAISWYYLKGQYGFIKAVEMKVRSLM
eukprot:gene15444-6693_t